LVVGSIPTRPTKFNNLAPALVGAVFGCYAGTTFIAGPGAASFGGASEKTREAAKLLGRVR
jgi:hypothetical protein